MIPYIHSTFAARYCSLNILSHHTSAIVRDSSLELNELDTRGSPRFNHLWSKCHGRLIHKRSSPFVASLHLFKYKARDDQASRRSIL